jgi:hypothetical protein
MWAQGPSVGVISRLCLSDWCRDKERMNTQPQCSSISKSVENIHNREFKPGAIMHV